MSDKTFQLDIVTPERKVFSEKVDFAVFPGSEGELGILFDHAPLLSRLDPGEIRITRDKKTECMAISGGFLEVRKNDVSVITETAERCNEIDMGRALREMESAEMEMKKAQSFAEIKAAKYRVMKAEARIKVAKKAAGAQAVQEKK
ncbi:MAG TPA: F0F1 ATP synthase subunit epsilon [Chitinivibrionales bacterium]|nr:F0F1 ATP synthase subunit epsilon [Chitinivibrionales bacterium]